MSYYKTLGLTREPFSTSPDPAFFYHSSDLSYSTGHYTALKRLEISLRLRRGLNLIVGDVGTGKTTLMRTLIQAFAGEDDFVFHLMLDPSHQSEYQFLVSLCSLFGIPSAVSRSTIELREEIEKHLFRSGVEEHKTTTLLIDEGQKISRGNLEVVRTLLNYETNEFKLLQVVIMAQAEILPRIRPIRNFTDRVALKYTLNPFDEHETKAMIEYRLKQAGYAGGMSLFSDDAVRIIHACTQGYPRRITMLCHDALKTIVMQDSPFVSADVIRGLTNAGGTRDYERTYLP